ncbi:acyl-CoA dehydrogenase family protein, partial [Alicyclobacillus sendaiensis]
AAGAMGIAQKALLEVMHRVRHRRSFGHVLQDHALIRRDLTDFAVRHAGGLALTFQAIDLFDRSWHERPPYSANYHLARLYTHLAKTRTADHAAHLTAMAMELFGGIGFLEEYGIARWHREALITPIWEGPSNIQALDFLETLMKLGHGDDVIERITSPITRANAPGGADAASRLRQEVAALRTLPRTEAEWRAKFVLRMMADVAQAASLYQIAETAGERYEKLGHLYLTHFIGGQEYPSWALYDVSIWGWM